MTNPDTKFYPEGLVFKTAKQEKKCNEFYNPAPLSANCCASKYLQKRSDDTLDIAVKRYQTYEKNTEPLIKFYKNLNLLKVVNGESPIPQINAEISALIDSIEG